MGIPCSTIYSTQYMQQYGLHLRKFVHTNLPQAGFELISLGPQASLLPNHPPLLVELGRFSIYIAVNG